MKKFKRHTITTALPYANGPIHIGHLAGVYVPGDIYARYLRMKEEDVLFIGGSDEHGVPITIKAKNEGLRPQDIVDRYHGIIRKSFEDFGISFDIYSRTSSAIHHQTASEFFTKLNDKGEFEVKTNSQYFDSQANQFLADRYITGTCPHCGYEKAYGDQCESCGTSLSPQELLNPVSALTGNVPIEKETTHWYLPLQNYEGWLRKWILEDHKEDWKANVLGQVKSWLDIGLQARAVTRDLDWGVEVPLDEAEGKVLYVWFDAPIGYISASKEWSEKTGKDWKPYWKDENTRLLHFIGKDNIVFHCIIFPAMLKQEGSYILPENVPAFEFMNLEGDKISTSRNWAVWLHEYLEDFPQKQDVLRYVLTANAPENKDNDFTWKDFQARNNNELLAVFGNFVNRIVVLTHKYFDGRVPKLGKLSPDEEILIQEIANIPARVSRSLDRFRFREALSEMMSMARLGNKYLTDSEPWKIWKTDPERVQSILNLSIQIAANLAIVAAPFLPHTAQKMKTLFNLPDYHWKDAGNSKLLQAGHPIEKAKHLFEKIDDEQIQRQIDKLQQTKADNAEANITLETQKKPVSFDDFQTLDIRTATILEAEKVAKTKKLLKIKLDTGIDHRTVVSGIAEYYKPEELTGKQVLVLLNLPPRKLKGIESQGMILMAKNHKGELCFVSPEKEFHPGSSVH